MTPAPLASAGPYALSFLPGTSRTLILSCASIGHDPTRPPMPEWARATRPHPTLFLTDAARSWASAPGLGPLVTQTVTALRTHHPFDRILALGSSMGAFMALTLSRIVPLDALIAIGPQYRPAAPWESRWSAHTRSLPADLTAPASAAAQTYLLHGADDLAQARDFAERDHLFFPGQLHATLPAHLKPAMPALILAALTDRRRALRLLSQAGGTSRARFFAAPSSPTPRRPLTRGHDADPSPAPDA